MWYTMIDKITKYYIIYFILGVIYILFLKDILIFINVYYSFVRKILILIFVLSGYLIPFINKQILKIIYFSYLVIFLYFRKTKTGFNFEFYLPLWLNNIFTNKTIFINILGNIILFIPLGVITNKNIIYAFIIVIIVELSQVLLKRGIFDIVDILLNYIGISLGILGVYIWKKIKTKMKKI